VSDRPLAVITGAARGLVTSAGLIPNSESVLDMDLRSHDRMWRVNYHGTLHACRSFGRLMRSRRRGAIVTLGSINSLHPLPLPAYNPGTRPMQAGCPWRNWAKIGGFVVITPVSRETHVC